MKWKEGIEYYRKLTKQAPHRRLRRIFEVLAEEEERHIHAIYCLIEKRPWGPKSDLIPEAKAAFAAIIDEGFEVDPTTPLAMQYAKAYRHAYEVERKNRDVYLDFAAKAREKKDKIAENVFLELADEEARHMILVDILFKTVTEPLRWTESEEFLQWQALAQ